MPRAHGLTVIGLLAVLAVPTVLTPPAFGGATDLELLSILPPRHALTVGRGTTITVEFDRPVDAATFDLPYAFHVFGERTGAASGTIGLQNAGATMCFTPDSPFARGERVFVVMSTAIEGTDGSGPATGYAWDFRIEAAAADMEFDLLATLDTTEPGVSPRPYGGSACDLDGDRVVDIAIVNEDTSDIRVFLNKADGSGLFDAFIQPSSPVGSVPSPNHAVDLNGDGLVDMCTANHGGATVSVVFGNGDGTFSGRTDYGIGSTPAGLAVLDLDGDGDMDIAASNAGSSNIALLVNDGAGAFGAATFIEGGGAGEYALAAADMNNDGIYDLVVGAQTSGRVIVQLGNGDGTFKQQGTVNSGQAYWMIVTSDVNGDGHMDVTSANGFSGTASIHFGDGTGNLGPATTHLFGGGMVATDTGDLDGDGDLDWVLSNFALGEWYLMENDGAGAFTHIKTFPAGANCACAIVLDFDVDGDLDLALIDEITDEIFLQRNTSTPPHEADLNGDGLVTFADLLILLASWGPCPAPPADCPADLNDDGDVAFGDLILLLSSYTMP